MSSAIYILNSSISKLNSVRSKINAYNWHSNSAIADPKPGWERRRVERGVTNLTPYKSLLATEMLTTDQEITTLGKEGSSSRGLMTLGGESRKSTEATRPTPLLSTRTINVGTWKVRTMYETGKTSQVATEMKSYNLTARNQRDPMDTVRTKKTAHGRDAAVFWSWRT